MIECEFIEHKKKAKLRHVVAEAIVVKDGKVGLVKRSMRLSEAGKWAIPGGYMERGETTAETAGREAQEETGWQVKVKQLFVIKDDPKRYNDENQNVAFVYLTEAVKEVQEMDHESDEFKWFDLDDLPPKAELAFDHDDTLKLYIKYLQSNLKLPVFN